MVKNKNKISKNNAAQDSDIAVMKNDILWIKKWMKKEFKDIKENHLETIKKEISSLHTKYGEIEKVYMKRLRPRDAVIFASLLSLLVGLITFLLTK